jgi:GNAT superfamily N-acetyltransferase
MIGGNCNLFEQRVYDFGDFVLSPLRSDLAKEIATRMASMEPWCTLRKSSAVLAASLVEPDDHYRRWVIRRGLDPIGVLGIRCPWLYGPYVALLAIFHEHQRRGVGGGILGWIERQAQGSRNTWVCVSSFNTRAQLFYTRHGYLQVGELQDLLVPGHSELLLRKRLA